ncbi:MAG: polysaccharide biosynthesis tyrosine autokinase [Pyrinomonadaceae bacterium]
MEPISFESDYADDYYGSANQSDERLLMRAFLSSLRKHWLLVVVLNLMVTSAVIVYVAQKPDYYRAETRIQVNAEINPAAGAGRNGANPVIVNNPGSDPTYFATQLQILEGGGLLRRVTKTLDLEHSQAFLDPQQGRSLTLVQYVERMFGRYRPTSTDLPVATVPRNDLNLNAEALDPEKETERFAPAVGRIKGGLMVSPVKDPRAGNRETRLIEIGFTHEDPQVAAKVANTIADAFVLQNLEQKIQSNASAGDFLQKRVAELQAAIRSGEESLINYSKGNTVVPPDASQNTVVQRFGDLNMKLGQATNDRIAAQTLYQAALQNQMRSATAERSDTQVVGLENRLNELRQKLVQLKTQYTEDWPEIPETRKQIESVENQLASVRKRASDIQIAGLKEKLNEAMSRERQLSREFENQRGEVVRQNEASINYRIIQQEIETNKTLLDGIMQRSRENDVILNGTPNNVLVADRASVPGRPVGPERWKSVILAFVISLFAGAGIAFGFDWIHDLVHHSDEIESSLGFPLLGAIPAVRLGIGDQRWNARLPLLRKKRHRSSPYDRALIDKPDLAEPYLQLRTNLMLSTPGGAPRIILVTSGEENEGKTLTAFKLAENLANTGEPVLLVDCDLRCPRVHSIMNLANKFGLTTLLTAKNIENGIIEATIQKNGGSLHFLTAGERSATPTNLLQSNEMRSLLTRLSMRYTHIVIDSPPVLYFADSIVLSTLVDGVIVVVRDNVSSRQMVLKARKALLSVGANIVGMVMNGVPRQRAYYYKEKYYMGGEDLAAERDTEILNLN